MLTVVLGHRAIVSYISRVQDLNMGCRIKGIAGLLKDLPACRCWYDDCTADRGNFVQVGTVMRRRSHALWRHALLECTSIAESP